MFFTQFATAEIRPNRFARGQINSELLDGCSSYYKKQDNQGKCNCGNMALIPSPVSTVTADCKTGDPGTETCDAPYCINLFTCTDTGATACKFPNNVKAHSPCTAASSEQAGYIYYAIQIYTPSGIIGSALSNIINDFNGLFQGVSNFFKNLPMYLAIGAGALILIFIIYALVKHFLLDKHESADSQPKSIKN